MATHILLIEPDEASATEFEENAAMFMEADITKVQAAIDATSLLQAGVRPDIALLTWDRPAGRGPDLVQSLRSLAPHLPIVLVLDEGVAPSSEMQRLNIQSTLNKPLHYPELRGILMQAISDARSAQVQAGNSDISGMQTDNTGEAMSNQSSESPPLQEHIPISETQTQRMAETLREFDQLGDGLPLLLSQDGVMVATSEAMPREAAMSLAKLAGRVWREGATHPTMEWLRFDDQLPATGGERRNIALYSVLVAGDVTLSAGWDGMLALSLLRASTYQAATRLAGILGRTIPLGEDD